MIITQQVWRNTQIHPGKGSVLTVSRRFVLIFRRVRAVACSRAGTHAEEVPGRWFQTRDDDTGSLGACRRVAQLLMLLLEKAAIQLGSGHVHVKKKKKISFYLLVIFDLVFQDGQCCLLGLLPGESDAVGRRPVLLQSPDQRRTWWRHGHTGGGRQPRSETKLGEKLTRPTCHETISRVCKTDFNRQANRTQTQGSTPSSGTSNCFNKLFLPFVSVGEK